MAFFFHMIDFTLKTKKLGWNILDNQGKSMNTPKHGNTMPLVILCY